MRAELTERTKLNWLKTKAVRKLGFREDGEGAGEGGGKEVLMVRSAIGCNVHDCSCHDERLDVKYVSERVLLWSDRDEKALGHPTAYSPRECDECECQWIIGRV